MQVFKNGVFISCEDKNRVFTTLVEDKGKIIFTGDEVPQEYESISNIVDLKGMSVVPAFADTHMHFESFALFRSTFDVRDAADFNDLGDIITTYSQNNKNEEFLIGFGCSAHTVKERRLPNKKDLDKITSLPLMIVKYDGHAAVANSALIDKFPPSVTYDSGFNKETGWLYQNAFYNGVNHITQSIPPIKILNNFIDASDYLAKKGIGLIHTVEGVGYKGDIDVDTMRKMSYGLPQCFRIFFQTMDVSKVVKRNMRHIGGCFSLALDGCFGSEDAALNSPYNNSPNNKGVLFYSQDRVNEFVKEANRNNLQISLHAIGDAAVEQAIIAYETALSDFPREDHRHTIIHSDLIPMPLLERAAKLGLQIAVQTPFLYWDQEPGEYIEGILGKERAKQMIPIKTMVDHGIIIGGGSDAPCTIPNPIEGIYAACNHPNPEESLSILDALRMHTNWAARMSFDENTRGTLINGKIADFTILDKNPLETPAKDLNKINVKGIYFRGKKYTKPHKNSAGLILNSLWNKLTDKEFQ